LEVPVSADILVPFEIALFELKQGKRIRRAGWPDDHCLRLQGKGIVYTDGVHLNHVHYLCDDLLAEDWEVLP
jgi:hypothetical protein